MIFWRIAWRDVWRYKLRSGLTLSAVAFATGLIMFVAAFTRGVGEQVINSGIKIQHGHLQIHRQGYFKDPTVDKSFALDDRLVQLLDSDKSIQAFSPRIRTEGQISRDVYTAIGMLMGIRPTSERALSVIDDRMKSGEYLTDGDTQGCLIGEDMAHTLHAKLGDALVLSTLGYDHLPADKTFIVAGIFKANSPMLDRGSVIVSLAGIRDLLYMPEEVTEVAVLLKNSNDLESVMTRLERIRQWGAYEIIPWTQIIPELLQMINWKTAARAVYMALVVIVVACGVLMTILMSVLERFKEFGIMKALGTRPARIFRLVMAESLILTLVGAAAGLLLGLSVSIYFMSYGGIDPRTWANGKMADTYGSFGIDTVIHSKVEPWMVVIVVLAVIVITFLMALWPALRAARTRPAEAIKYI